MILTKCNIDIPKYWEHDPNIKDNSSKVIEDYLLENKKEIPEHWKI